MLNDFYWDYSESYGLTLEGYHLSIYFDASFEESDFQVDLNGFDYGYMTLGNWFPI